MINELSCNMVTENNLSTEAINCVFIQRLTPRVVSRAELFGSGSDRVWA